MQRSKLLLATLMTSMLFLTSCLKDLNLKIPKLKGPVVTLGEESIDVKFHFTDIEYDEEKFVDIPKMPNSVVHIHPDPEDGVHVDVSLSIEDILGTDNRQNDPTTLPGGRDLPGIEGGRLPAQAVVIEKFMGSTIFYGENILGIFVPFDYPFPWLDGKILTTRFKLGGKTRGTLSAVGPDDNGEHSGVLLMLTMDEKTKKFLRKYLNKSLDQRRRIMSRLR